MKKVIFLLLLLVSSNSYTQNSNSGIDICIALKGFNSSSEANDALDRILSTIGVSKNFVMQECSNVSNASALQVEGVRYIFYNQQWMRNVNNKTSYGGLFTLAHEVGHHINGHALDWVLYATESVNSKTLSERRAQELEADEFAGFVLAKLGASLNETTAVIRGSVDNSDDTYSTHPSLNKRLASIKKGYLNGSGGTDTSNDYTTTTATNDIIFYDDGSRWEGAIKPSESRMVFDGQGNVSAVTTAEHPHGYGIMYYANGDVYKGVYYNGCPNGYGEMTYASGKIYKGQWLNCKTTGKGKIIKASGVSVVTISGVEEGENHYNSGISNYDSENYEEAILDFNKALELEYDLSGVYYFLGQCHYYLSDFKNGIKYLSLSNKIAPFAYSYYLIGIMQFDEKKYEATINSITKSIELDDGDDKKFLSKKHTMRARAKYYKDDDNGALKDLEKAIELNPSASFTLRFRAEVFNYLENYNKAIQDITKAIELDSKPSDYALRAKNYFKLNDYNKAIADYTKAIDMYPNNLDYVKNRGDSKLKLGDILGAINDYNKAIEIEPDHISSYNQRGRAKLTLEDYTGAIKDFTKIIDLGVNEAYAFTNRALAKRLIEDYAGAINDYTKAIELDPDKISYYFRGVSKYYLEDYTGAIKDYTKIIDLGLANSNIFYQRGVSKYNLKDYAGAILDYNKAIEFDSAVDLYYRQRAKSYYELQNYQAAKVNSTKAIELDPNNAYSYFLRAWHNYKLGDSSNACRDIKKAIELSPDDYNIDDEIYKLVCN